VCRPLARRIAMTMPRYPSAASRTVRGVGVAVVLAALTAPAAFAAATELQKKPTQAPAAAQGSNADGHKQRKPDDPAQKPSTASKPVPPPMPAPAGTAEQAPSGQGEAVTPAQGTVQGSTANP